MLRLETSVEISRPIEDVWNFLGDLQNSPQWTRSGSELRLVSRGSMGIGSTIESHRVFFGRFDVKSQVLTLEEFEPPRSVAMTARVGIAERASMRFALEPTANGTRLTRAGEIELTRGLRPLEPLLGRLMLGVWRRELANLRRLLETSAEA